MNIKTITTCLALVMQCALSFSQPASLPPPTIGKVCPDYTIHGVTKFPYQEVKISDFKGKFLILDFWGRNCINCIKSFPLINDLQNEFKENIQFMLITSNDKRWGSGVQEFFEKISDKYKLQIPSAYDSTLFPLFNIETVPQVVIIDRKGIIKAITNSGNLTHANLQKLITDNTFQISTSIANNEEEFPVRKEIINENQEVYQSTFSIWHPAEPRQITTRIDNTENGVAYQSKGISLERLYKIAYWGMSDWTFGDSLYAKAWPHLTIKTIDSLQLKSDFNSGKGYYNYSLVIPKSKNSQRNIQWAMQCDLKRYFGFQVSMEVKSMPCWELVTTDKWVKSKTKAAKTPEMEISIWGVSMTNRLVDDLLNAVWSYHQEQPPLINATGITGNIDLKINALMTDFNDIQKALNLNGLALIKSHRDMKVMVIR